MTRTRLVLLSAALFAALMALASQLNADWANALDASVETWLDTHRSARLRVDSAGAFRFLGSPIHVGSAALAFGALLSARNRSALPALLIVGGVGVGVGMEQALKATIGRTPATLAALHDGSLVAYQHSYPSGHVTGSAALLGMSAVCLGAQCNRATKTVLAALVVAGVLAVAFLALYSRAHICTDVIGGMFLGGAIVALGAATLAPSARPATHDAAQPVAAPAS